MPFGNDPIAEFRRREKKYRLADGSTSVLADLEGTAVDPEIDPVEAFRKVDTGPRRVGRAGLAFERGMEAAFTPIEGVVDFARENAQMLANRRQATDDPWEARLLGFFEGVQEPIAGMSSPADIGLTAFPLARGLTGARGVQRALAGAEAVLGAAQTGQGAAHLEDVFGRGFDDTSATDKAIAAGSTLAGAAGSLDALGALRRLTPEPVPRGRRERKLLGSDPVMDPDYWTRTQGDSSWWDQFIDVEDPRGGGGGGRPELYPETLDAQADVVGRGRRVAGRPVRGELPAADPDALYPAGLPPHGPIRGQRPPTALERPDLLTDTELLDALSGAMQGARTDHFRVFLAELGQRRQLSTLPERAAAPTPPAAPQMPAGAVVTGRGVAPKGKSTIRVAGPAGAASDADAVAYALEQLRQRAGEISTRTMPTPIDRSAPPGGFVRRAPGPEFEPVSAAGDPDDALAAVEELLGGGLSPDELAEQAYQTVRGKWERGEQLTTSGRVLEDMAGVRDAREAARGAVEAERGSGNQAGRVAEGAQPGGRDPQRGGAETGGLDVQRGVHDRALGGEAGSAPAAFSAADEAYFQRVAADARRAGFDGSDAELRAAFQRQLDNARAWADESTTIDLEAGDRGMLQAVAEMGGINAKAERASGGMGTELDDLQRALGGVGTYNKRTRALSPDTLLADVRIPGITGPIVTRRTIKTGPNIVPAGVTLDEAVQRLNALGFKVEPEELADVLARAADRFQNRPTQTIHDIMYGAGGVGRPGVAWWKNGEVIDEFADLESMLDDAIEPAGDVDLSFNPREWEDILDTGEAQPRLPGAEGVRAQEVATPQVADAPFALTREVDAPAPARAVSVLDEIAGEKTVAPPTFEQLPANVRAYLTKRLGWTPEEINALDVDTAIAHGRNQVRPVRSELAEAPTAESRRVTEGRQALDRARAVDAENDLLGELERFFELEQPARAARAEERKGLVRAQQQRRAAPVKGEPGQRQGPRQRVGEAPPGTLKKAVEGTAAAREGMEEARAESAAFQALSESDKKSHSATVAAQQRAIQRAIEEAWNDPRPSQQRMARIAALYEEQAEHFLKGQLKGGTGKEMSNDELAALFSAQFGGLGALFQKPEHLKALFGAMVKMPSVRGLVGAWIGAQNDPDGDEFKGALYGAILAAGVPSGAKALARGLRQRRAGRFPWPIFEGPTKDKDLSFLRAYILPSPERAVPEVFRKTSESIANLQEMWEKAYPGDRGMLLSLSRKRLANEIRHAAVEAEAAKQPRKKWYLEQMANSLEGRLTEGQQKVKRIGKNAFGRDWKGTEVERHVAGNIYRVLIGFGVDSAMKNLSQPLLSMLYVSPKSLAKAYRVSRTPAARALAEKFDVNIRNIAELADTEIVNRAGAKPKKAVEIIEDAASAPIRVSDNFNRRVTLMAALEEAGKLDDALAGRLSHNDPAVLKAMSVMRKTQGHTGPLGSNPHQRGPIVGSLKPFAKFPLLFIENVMDAFQDPDARGAQFVATLMGAALVGRMFNIDLEELLLSGGRPLGLDFSDPMKTVRGIAAGKPFPAVRAVKDAASHATGEADHPITEDLPQLLVGRYPMKFKESTEHVMRHGLGEHPSAAGTAPEHTGIDDLLGLVGLRTQDRGDTLRAREEQYEFSSRAQRDAAAKRRQLREDWREAFEDGDEDALAELERLMSPEQRRQLRREAEQTPDQRMRSRVPRDSREDFDRRFGGR